MNRRRTPASRGLPVLTGLSLALLSILPGSTAAAAPTTAAQADPWTIMAAATNHAATRDGVRADCIDTRGRTHLRITAGGGRVLTQDSPAGGRSSLIITTGDVSYKPIPTRPTRPYDQWQRSLAAGRASTTGQPAARWMPIWKQPTADAARLAVSSVTLTDPTEPSSVASNPPIVAIPAGGGTWNLTVSYNYDEGGTAHGQATSGYDGRLTRLTWTTDTPGPGIPSYTRTCTLTYGPTRIDTPAPAVDPASWIRLGMPSVLPNAAAAARRSRNAATRAALSADPSGSASLTRIAQAAASSWSPAGSWQPRSITRGLQWTITLTNPSFGASLRLTTSQQAAWNGDWSHATVTATITGRSFRLA